MMKTKNENVCPFCGGPVHAIESEVAFIGGGYRGVCGHCSAQGNQFSCSFRAIAAFCHPAHLLEGKVLISIEDVAEATTTICYSCKKAHICPGARSIPTTLCIVSRLCAAIDAAKGE